MAGVEPGQSLPNRLNWAYHRDGAGVTELLVVALTCGIAFFLLKSWFNYRQLPELPAGSAASNAGVTVVIPARNEASRITHALESFRGQKVIVVDDDSTDGTRRIALQHGANVTGAPPVPPGAFGKPNACLAGARQVTTDWILFVDADTWFEVPFVDAIVRYAQKESLQCVTAFLDSKHGTFLERILLPYAFALYFAGVSARSVNDPKSKEALANGQCMLFRRDAYERIGGHGAVLDSVIEDVAMARIAKLQRLKMRVVRAETLGHVRMYDSLRSIWRGFQKNSFRFLLVNPWTGLQVIAASILLTSWLPVLIYACTTGLRGRVAIEAVLLAVAPSLCLLPWYTRSKGDPIWTAAFAPLAIYLFQLIALDGMVSTVAGRKVHWKGRRV